MHIRVTLDKLYNVNSPCEFSNVQLLNSYFAYNYLAEPITMGGAADILTSTHRVAQELIALVRHLEANCEHFHIRIDRGCQYYTISHANWDPVQTAKSIIRDLLK